MSLVKIPLILITAENKMITLIKWRHFAAVIISLPTDTKVYTTVQRILTVQLSHDRWCWISWRFQIVVSASV